MMRLRGKGCGFRPTRKLLFIALLLLPAWPAPAQIAPADRMKPPTDMPTLEHFPRAEGVPREIRVAFAPECGANSLFFFLRLNGVDVTRVACLRDVPSTGRGASLDDLAQAAGRHGLKVKPLQVSMAGLDHIEFPVLAHLREDQATDTGHYIVLTDRRTIDGKTSISGIDGTTLRLTTMSAEYFAERFSGYCLVRENAVGWSAYAEPWLLAALWVEGGLLALLIGRPLWRWFSR